jgi:UDP-glucose 4-epimerase/UDP-glucuronate decarboxylase
VAYNQNGKRILITGGAGFIGFQIAKNLAENSSDEITIIDDLSKGRVDSALRKLLSRGNVNFIQLDLAKEAAWRNISADFDQIYHLAAVVGVRRVMAAPVDTLRVNALSTIYMLEYASKLTSKPKVLFASSCENYASTVSIFGAEIPTSESVPLCIEDPFNPRWTYACSKILGEIACIQYSERYGFDTTIARYHNVYGPRMGTDHVIPHFIQRLTVQRDVFDIYGGDQYRAFCYVDDAAQITINLMNNDEANGRVVNVGDDQNHIRIDTLAKMLFEMAGLNPSLKECGAPEGSVADRRPDLRLLRELKCDVPSTPLAKGLKEAFSWYSKGS